MLVSKYSAGLFIMLVAALLVGILVVGCSSDSEKRMAPHSIVLTLHGDASTSRAFTWVTAQPDTPTIIEIAVTDPSASFEQSAKLTFEGQTSPLAVGNHTAEVIGIHKVEATGLQPATTYSYRVGSGREGEWSSLLSFKTDPPPQEDTAMTFINVTDSQGITSADFKIWGKTLNQAFKQFPRARFIVHNGDLTENPEDERAWEQWFEQASPSITRVPILPVTGNHDEITDKEKTAHGPLPLASICRTMGLPMRLSEPTTRSILEARISLC